MIEYIKIDTLYKRDMEGSKKLLEGEFRNPTVEFLKDNKWIFTEKIDGTNISVYWDGHTVTFNGRTEKAEIPAHLLSYLTATFKTSEAEQIFEEKFGEMLDMNLSKLWEIVKDRKAWHTAVQGVTESDTT